MKLLLTSGGLMNQSIINALGDLCGREFGELKIAFIPTASTVEAGDKWWLIEDLETVKSLKFKEIDIVDVSAIPQSLWQKRLEHADVLLFEGGNNYHLMYWIKKSGLAEILPKLLEKRVYVGISAGSMVVAQSLVFGKDEKPFAEQIDGPISDEGLGFVEFAIEPHMNSRYFPERTFEFVEKRVKIFTTPVYALDDQSAVVVDGEKVEVVSEGKWKKFN